jgi:hypothetical protein
LEKEWLETYEREEGQIARELGERCLARSSLEAKGMYTDKIAFKDTYAYEMGVSPSLLLPFYDQVLTHLLVPPTPELFEYDQGMNVETVASLYERRRLIPIISFPTYYEGLDYLDPLLELKPPTLVRQDILCKILAVKRGYDKQRAVDFNAEAKKRILGRFGPLSDEFRRHNVPVDPASIESSLINHHVELKCLGFDTIADRILSMDDTRSMFLESFTYAMVLAKPIIEGLGGWPQGPETLLRHAKERGLEPNLRHVFPTEAGTLLTKTYQLSSIIPADNKTIDSLYTEKAITNARNLLWDLSAAIRARDLDQFTAKSMSADEIFNDARDHVKSIEKVRKVFGSFVIGAIGWFVGGVSGALAGGLLAHFIGELGGTLASDSADRAFNLVAEPFSKLGIASLPISIWRFEQDWRKILSHSPPTP